MIRTVESGLLSAVIGKVSEVTSTTETPVYLGAS